jgi:hypothetical protein
VRVAGTSMDGGGAPLHDGDWAVMRVARGAPAGLFAIAWCSFRSPAKLSGASTRSSACAVRTIAGC